MLRNIIHWTQWWIYYKRQRIKPDYFICDQKYFSSNSKRRLYLKQASKSDWLVMDAKLILFVISATIAVAASYPFEENLGFIQQAQCNENTPHEIDIGSEHYVLKKCSRSMLPFLQWTLLITVIYNLLLRTYMYHAYTHLIVPFPIFLDRQPCVQLRDANNRALQCCGNDAGFCYKFRVFSGSQEFSTYICESKFVY